MSYSLVIGKARYVNDYDEYGDFHLWDIEECEGPPPHVDEWEMSPFAGDPTRSPGYGQWHECLKELPCFKGLWDNLHLAAIEHQWDLIPVTHYVRDLDELEAEALAALDRSAAARALWFVRWSRHALKLYGEAAVFQTPGEWIDWSHEPEALAIAP